MPGEGIVALYAAPVSFLLNEICLNQLVTTPPCAITDKCFVRVAKVREKVMEKNFNIMEKSGNFVKSQ